MKGPLIVIASLLACSAAFAQNTNESTMQPNLSGQSVDCSAFKREDDGSWTALKNVPIQRQGESAGLEVGTNVKPGGPKVAGIDVAATLTAVCPK